MSQREERPEVVLVGIEQVQRDEQQQIQGEEPRSDAHACRQGPRGTSRAGGKASGFQERVDLPSSVHPSRDFYYASTKNSSARLLRRFASQDTTVGAASQEGDARRASPICASAWPGSLSPAPRSVPLWFLGAVAVAAYFVGLIARRPTEQRAPCGGRRAPAARYRNGGHPTPGLGPVAPLGVSVLATQFESAVAPCRPLRRDWRRRLAGRLSRPSHRARNSPRRTAGHAGRHRRYAGGPRGGRLGRTAASVVSPVGRRPLRLLRGACPCGGRWVLPDTKNDYVRAPIHAPTPAIRWP